MGRRRLLRISVLFALLSMGAVVSLSWAQGKKSKKPKLPDLEILSAKFIRDGNNIEIDGSLRNTGDKPVAGLVLLFNFFSPNKESLTIQNGPVEAKLVEVGESVEFRFIVKAPPRATSVLVEAQDKNQRDLTVENNGQFTIE